jgi:DNA polymerase I-like protein with 3'-5' exonuclease and polymerase domains
VKVWRRDRVQTAGGAVASALYGAAFGLQQANMRAAANHEIQSPGGQITKNAQRMIWDLQPIGVHELVVAPMNVHDELMCVTHPDYIDKVSDQVSKSVESYRPQVPLIGMTWNKAQANWAEKKGGSVTVKMRAPEMMD